MTTNPSKPVIVVGVDFSEASKRAMEAAARLALDLKARVVLVHAFTNQPHVPGLKTQQLMDAITELKLEQERHEAVTLSTEWAGSLRARGLEVETMALEESPVAAVLHAAEETDASMIVVGRHGWGAVKRFILGSVADQLVRRSPRPVLVVPPES